MRLSRRLVTWIIVGIGVLILSPILFCVGTIIYEELRPSATAQLLDFAELPPDTPLPQRDTGFADRIDYHYVEDRLRERFPVGTSEQELNTFMTKHDNPCVRDKQKI